MTLPDAEPDDLSRPGPLRSLTPKSIISNDTASFLRSNVHEYLLSGSGRLAACVMLALIGSPAWACPGPHAEKYLIWFDLPETRPGEIALEIDIRDYVEKHDSQDSKAPVLKVKSVLAGRYDEDTIAVRRSGSICGRDAATGTATRFVIVGELLDLPSGERQLIPRYMSYDDSIRVAAAARSVKERDAQ